MRGGGTEYISFHFPIPLHYLIFSNSSTYVTTCCMSSAVAIDAACPGAAAFSCIPITLDTDCSGKMKYDATIAPKYLRRDKVDIIEK